MQIGQLAPWRRRQPLRAPSPSATISPTAAATSRSPTSTTRTSAWPTRRAPSCATRRPADCSRIRTISTTIRTCRTTFRINDVRYADSSRIGAVDIDGDGVSDFEGTGSGLRSRPGAGTTPAVSRWAVDNTRTAGYQGDLFPGLRRNLVECARALRRQRSASACSSKASTWRPARTRVSQPDVRLLPAHDAGQSVHAGHRSAMRSCPARRRRFSKTIACRTVRSSRATISISAINAERRQRARRRAASSARTAAFRIARNTRCRTSGARPKTDIIERQQPHHEPLARRDRCRNGPGQRAAGLPLHSRSRCDPGSGGLRAVQHLRRAHARIQAARDFILTDSSSRSTVTQKVVSGSVSGDFGSFLALPGGSIGYAIGAEYRKETQRLPARSRWSETG